MRRLNTLLLSSLLIAFAPSCSTITDARKQKMPYMDNYYSGNISQAASDLSEKSTDRAGSGDELMWLLESGTTAYSAHDYKQSLHAFEKAELLIQDFNARATINARAAAAEIGSSLSNSNALPYQGMYLDRIMLNAYKALNYFALNQPESAHVELRRMRETQKNVVRQFKEDIYTEQQKINAERYKNQQKSSSFGNQNTALSFDQISQNSSINTAYRDSANKSNKLYGSLANPFVSYFSALGYLLENNDAEALVDFRRLYQMNPHNNLIQRDYVSTAQKIGSEIPSELENIPPYPYALNNKIVYILFFNGRAPALKQEKFQLILPYVGYTGIAFPRYEYFPTRISSLNIHYTRNTQKQSARTETIADFDAIMSQEYHQKLPAMVTRLVVSTLSKELASYAAIHAARQAGGAAMILAYLLTGSYKYLFNTADTRGWETLPKEIQVSHIPLPDDGLLTISPISKANGLINNTQQDKQIALKSSTRIAIVSIRALAGYKLHYQLFEIE